MTSNTEVAARAFYHRNSLPNASSSHRRYGTHQKTAEGNPASVDALAQRSFHPPLRKRSRGVENHVEFEGNGTTFSADDTSGNLSIGYNRAS